MARLRKRMQAVGVPVTTVHRNAILAAAIESGDLEQAWRAAAAPQDESPPPAEPPAEPASVSQHAPPAPAQPADQDEAADTAQEETLVEPVTPPGDVEDEPPDHRPTSS
ncbi:MAG: hypothetical protein KY462_13140 [Actinobacteria bacterium]|nr:hypothetical protein [Actinomycetota bacterium]